MLVFDHTPELKADDLTSHYRRIACEGMAHSAVMRGERFEMADVYDEAWATPALTWSSGGRETYSFAGKRTVVIEPAGVLSIAAGERYAYDAARAAPFRSNMISFPRWMTNAAAKKTEFGESGVLDTRLCRPSPETFSLMTSIACRCASGESDPSWYEERAALLYHRLLSEQARNNNGANAAKETTRKELARRIERGAQFMLQHYRNSSLSIGDIAAAACLSRFHLIRVFKDVAGKTPMQYLAGVRMEAAMRLLKEGTQPVEDVAGDVGYASRTAFIRAFRRRYGATPAAVRNQLQ